MANLETSLGDMEYRFKFDGEETALKFAAAVTERAFAAEREIVKKVKHLCNSIIDLLLLFLCASV